MARTRNRTQATAETVTVNAMDKIVAKLNTLEGIEFAKDAWVNKAPTNYGVLRLSGEARQMWADGHLVDSSWTLVLDAYVEDDSDEYPAMIQEKLEALEDEGVLDLTHTNNREFDYQNERIVKFHGQKFRVVRTYLTDDDGIEITVERSDENGTDEEQGGS